VEFDGIDDDVDAAVTLGIKELVEVDVGDEEEVVDNVEELDEVEWSFGRSTIVPTGTANALPFVQQLVSVPQQYEAVRPARF
jgi:hypothetical protein